MSREEYEKGFKCIRDLIEKIEHDPRLGWEGFEAKQELREVVRTLLKVERKILI